MTTYKIGGHAKWYAEPRDLEELRSILAVVPAGTEIVVIGRGSNIVVADAGIDGLVLRLGNAFSAVDVSERRIVAGGAVALPKLARLAAASGCGGLGFYVGIPGSVGGAVCMNAGGHGSATADVLESAVIVDLSSGSLTKRENESLGFGYRRSNISDKEIVVQASFTVTVTERTVAEAELRDITRWRKEHQPGGTLNAGSVFKNPVEESAGAIIDRCGLKGLSVGGASVSEKHANFVVLAHGAEAKDIFLLVKDVQRKVLDKTGVILDSEIRFMGDFDPLGEHT